MRALFIALVLMVVSACASSPSTPTTDSPSSSQTAAPKTPNSFTPAPPAPAGYATLYILRGYVEHGAAVWPIAFLNDVKVAAVKTNSYTYVYIWPGKYHLRIEKSFFLTQYNTMKAFDFTIPGEGTYYLQFGNGGSTAWLPAGRTFVPISSGNYGWFLVAEGAAEQVLPSTRYQPALTQTVGHP
jgi:hypothetical protein